MPPADFGVDNSPTVNGTAGPNNNSNNPSTAATANGDGAGTTNRTYPKDVGIVCMDIYFPSTYVDQPELEMYDGVSQGKYTLGLGQQKMAVCGDNEDINSICLTVVKRLVETFQISYKDIGRLEVGTETIIDKSKSVKTYLMQLFEESGNTDVEGIDCTNACYGGTSALLNTIAWVESSAWDGRYGLVVAGDIAVYGNKVARPTGGAGVVAMLIGPNAPIVIDSGYRATHMEHVYDFYKPDLSCEYPTVDGKLSNICYLRALDNCYSRYCEKYKAKEHRTFTINDTDYIIFHTPYVKLVQKSIGRLYFLDFLRNPDAMEFAKPGFEAYRNVKPEETYFDDKLERFFRENSQAIWDEKSEPCTLLPRNLGNSYCGSLYSALISLLTTMPAEALDGKHALLFSYGSGLAATMFSVRLKSSAKAIADRINVMERLQSRQKITPEEFSDMLLLREKGHASKSYSPATSTERLAPGTFYLTQINEKHHRFYQIKA